ncbi:hypothetical protein GCM10009616_05140 [Microlunatus lacustris]
MILLELDPNVVKPGWTPLLILIGLALVMVLLFRSMRRQFRRVDDNFPEPAAPVGTPAAEADAAAPGIETATVADVDEPTPDERARRV